MKKNFLLLLLVILFCELGNSQNKSIVILGSSTAFGTGANPYDSSWAGKLQLHFRKNTSMGDPDTVVTNLALGGQYTFSIMPTGYVFPPGYPMVNPARNITQALSLNPDLIIINLPSNDQVWPFPNWESMNNFRIIYGQAQLNNKRCFITTTQPVNHGNPNVRDSLRKMVDSIKNNFGSFAIDFWTPLASPAGDSSIRADLNSDGTHVNNTGHRLLFEQVIAEDLFPANSPLPLKLASFSANRQNSSVVLKWTTSEEEPDTKFEVQRSANGREFSTVATLNATGNINATNYSWADHQPLDGKSYYRLKITEPSKTSYSKIISLPAKNKLLSIQSVYTDGSNLHLNIFNQRSGTVEISLVNLAGALVKKQTVTTNNTSQFTITISDIPTAEYIIRITDSFGNVDTQRFVKLK